MTEERADGFYEPNGCCGVDDEVIEPSVVANIPGRTDPASSCAVAWRRAV